MRLGIVVTDESFLGHVIGLFDAALARRWEVDLFLTDTGVNLLADSAFVDRARARPKSVSICRHSAEHFGAGRIDMQALADAIVLGGQYQDAKLVRVCDQVLVL